MKSGDTGRRRVVGIGILHTLNSVFNSTIPTSTMAMPWPMV